MDRSKIGGILMGELIGESVKITKSSDRTLAGAEGKIVDETLKTLTIESKGREKKISKKNCEFEINGMKVPGKDLCFRPEDRIKKYWRKFDGTMRR
ncbi:MAG: ribonuclease P protein subunit [Candidatus Micrarchaeota archaeon]